LANGQGCQHCSMIHPQKDTIGFKLV